MTNAFYNHDDGYPATGSQGASSAMRAEFDKVAAGFDLLPTNVSVPRTSDTVLAPGNKGNFINYTTAGFTQTVTAAATLGNGWNVYLRNSAATGVITIDPNGAETIDGQASVTLNPGDSRLIFTDGTSFYTASGNGLSGKTLLSTINAATLASVNFLTGFNSAYDDYEIHLDTVVPATSASNLQLQIAVAGVAVTTSTYLNAVNNSVTATATQANLTSAVVLHTGRGLNGKLLVSNVNSAPTLKSIIGMTAWQESASAFDGYSFQSFNTSASVVTGFLLKWDTGNVFTSGNIRIYGIRKNF